MADNTVTVSDADFEELVLKAQGPVLVDFWAPWCGPCKKMGPVLEALAGEYGSDTLVVAKLNVDENPEMQRKYGVMSIPTLIMFKAGEDTSKIVGFSPQDELKKRIDALL